MALMEWQNVCLLLKGLHSVAFVYCLFWIQIARLSLVCSYWSLAANVIAF
jgi:hypothetical protein